MGRLQEENRALKQGAVKLAEVEQQNADLSEAKSALATQIIKLSADVDAAKKEGSRAKMDNEGLKHKLAELEHKFEDLETENNELLAEQDDYKTTKHEKHILQSENTKLNAMVKELQGTAAVASGDGSHSSDKDRSELQEAISVLEKKNNGLEVALDEWTSLAKVCCYSRVIRCY